MGGMALVVVYVLVGLISYALFVNCFAQTPDLDGFSCLKYLIPLFIATGPGFEVLNDFLPNSAIFLINAIIWFAVGTIVGFIYGKIKNRNKI